MARSTPLFLLAAVLGCAPPALPPGSAPVAPAPFEGAGAVRGGVALPLGRDRAPDPRAASASEDPNTYRVPVGSSPVRGPATALVTLVEFSDFQCPFCARVQPTLEQLRAKYGDKLRMVFKQAPLSFHARAEPSAELTLEARAQKGDAGFWKVHDLVFAKRGQLDDEDLEEVAKAAGLDVAAAMRNVAAHKYRAAIEDDLDLGDDVHADGTPHFFINGKRLVGAQPPEAFEALIDEQLAVARALVASGVAPAKVYDTLQVDAVSGEPFEKVSLPAPTAATPTRGPKDAKVLVQIFSDFECPFCKRVEATLAALDAAFPGKLRFVWHNLPLPFHPHAELAAEAAMEAFAQKGPDGFWKMHAALFTNPGGGGLERQTIEGYAKTIGLDAAKFSTALDASAHRKSIDADLKLAESVGFRGTPAISVGGYKLSGAQPLARFSKAVRLALGEK